MNDQHADDTVITKACDAGAHDECPHRRNSKRSPCDCTCHQTGS